mgnify:FL=1
MDSYLNGNRIKIARKYRGLTIEEFANKIGITKQAVSNYELGKREPSYKELNAITNVLNFPYRYFVEKDNIEVNYNSTFFRSYLTAQKKYKEKQIIKVSHIRKYYSIISKYIKFPSLNLPEYNGESSPEDMAYNLRELWKLSDSPINNLLRIAEKNGIIVSFFDSSEDTNKIDAFTNFVDNIWIIALSKNTISLARTHFNIAHELGHIISHKHIMENNEELDRKDFNDIEDEANKFASSFLLPANNFIKDVMLYNRALKLDRFIELKKIYNVSIKAMIYRLFDLGIISREKMTNLYKQISKRGWNKEEPLDNINNITPPSLFRDSINLLLEKKFSVEELLDEFSDGGISLNSDDIEELLNLDKGKLKVNKIYDNPVIKMNDIIDNK